MDFNLDFIKKTNIQPSVELVGYSKSNNSKNKEKYENLNFSWDCICYECDGYDDDCNVCECDCDYDCYDCDCADCDWDCGGYDWDNDCGPTECIDCDCYTPPRNIHNNYASGGTHIVGVRFVTQTSGCYYYIGDNRLYNIGDKVVVSTSDGAEQMATVIFKRIYKDGETLPYNKNLLKTVIRKL